MNTQESNVNGNPSGTISPQGASVNNKPQETKTVETQPKKKSNTLLIIVIIVGVLALLGCGCCGIITLMSKNKTSNEESQTTQSTSNKTTTGGTGKSEETTNTTSEAEEQTNKIGEFVTTKNVEWRVDKVENLGSTINSNNQFIENGVTSGKFIRVTYTIKNNDKEEVNPAKPTIIDNQDREYEEWEKTWQFVENYSYFPSVNPGLTSTFVGIYDVAGDANGLKFKVWGGGLLEEETQYIDMGI
jgi:flagellar basal body-associated protein FliL